MNVAWWRALASALAVILVGSGCTSVRRVLRLEPEAPLPAELPTAAFLGADRMLSAPGEAAGRFEHVVFPATGASGTLAPGDSLVLLDLTGSGVVRRIRLDLASADPHWLRRIALRMHWDGEVEPSVHVPLGDFFGNGYERHAYASLPMGVGSDGFFSYLPLPFARGARVVLENGTDLPVEGVTFDADVEVEREPAGPVATFHALWSRDPRARPDRLHEVVDARGAGWFVGTILSAQGHDGTLAFLRGNGLFRVDGRTLDSASVAAYLGPGVAGDATVAGPLHGVVLRDDRGRLAAYRWHLADPIPFRSSFRLELQRGRANREAAEYATVAYWYQTEPHDPLPPLPGPHERRVPDVLVPPEAVRGDELDVIGLGTGAVRMSVPVPRPDRYEVIFYREASPGAVTPSVTVGGSERPARTLELSPPGSELGDVLPGLLLDTVTAIARAVELQLSAHGGGIALPAAIHARPIEHPVTEWWGIGSWPNPGITDSRTALEFIWGPDREPELDRSHALLDGQTAVWEPLDADADGAVTLAPKGGTAYAQAFLFAPRERSVTLVIESEGAPRVLVEGIPALARPARPGAAPGTEPAAGETDFSAYLRAGWNRVLVKLSAIGGPGRFRLRAADPFDELRWARTPS